MGFLYLCVKSVDSTIQCTVYEYLGAVVRGMSILISDNPIVLDDYWCKTARLFQTRQHTRICRL